MITVEERDQTTLENSSEKRIKNDTIIFYKKLRSYNQPKEYFNEHKTVNHSNISSIQLLVHIQIQLRALGLQLKEQYRKNIELKNT